ncbi:MAG: hypothetical protein IKV41_02775 [Oscillospiraceae bacterium]|nr:hypothetical protein [Oscillospiraceae bacterium]
MKTVRLIIGLVVMAGTLLMGGVIVKMLKDYNDNKYTSAYDWNDDMPF